MYSLEVLDFPEIQRRLADHCSSTISKEMALSLEIMHDKESIVEALGETEEALQSLQNEVEQPLGGTRDLRACCVKVRKEMVLTREQLWDIYTSLGAYKRLKKFFLEKYLLYPRLSLWAQDIVMHDNLERRLERTFDSKGELLDSASPRLQQIRSTILRTKSYIKSALQEVLHDKDSQKYFQEAIVTQRNNRYVIPVKQEYRQAFPGILHDKSATGATLYIEPLRIVEVNNELQEALVEEEQEILRIYKDLSLAVRRESDTIMDACERVSHIEFVYGKAKLALSMKAQPATCVDEQVVDLIDARHPLISADRVVPTTIRLGEGYRILLITGSNTGGKTVSMKTLGLLALMHQAGLCIPAKQGSKLPVFKRILADIGDEQSIEASLSTFSSHMTQVISILNHVGGDDLVLLDELGSGTDPEEGSALAIAVLDYLRMKQPLLMVSTHYNELKHYGYHTEGVENGHVEFDERSLKPTYRLHIGTAGSSHAFSIVDKLGMPRVIIERAKRQKEQSAHSEMESVLSNLTAQLRKNEERERQLKKELDEARKITRQLESEKREFNEKRKRILAKARDEAQELKQSFRVEGEQLIKELKQSFSENDKQKRQGAIDNARRGISGMNVPELEDDRDKLTLSDLSVGMMVFVKSMIRPGTITQIRRNKITVDVNSISVTVNLDDLAALSGEEKRREQRLQAKKSEGPAKRKNNGQAVARQQAASTELNIIGKRVDEATVEVGRFIDQAILAGISPVRIIHGKGTGLLREGVHNYLRRLPQVERFEMAGYQEGGAGATNVYLK